MSPSSENNAAPRPLILIVDDEPRIIRFVRINLEMEGFRVLEAHNGLEAVEQVQMNLPDLVILDVMTQRLLPVHF